MITFLLTGFWDLITGFIRPKHPVDMNSQQIKGLPAPTQDDHAARKKYVDDQPSGGDMTKAVYDPNEDGIVKDSDKLETNTKAQVQDHIPKAHTLASHSTKAHNELTEVTENQHHAQAHNLASHSTKAHTELTGVTSDQHHAQAHTLASHSTKAHSELTGVSPDQHHAQAHNHVEAHITDLDHNAQKIKSKLVDAPVAGDDGKVLAYDHANSKYKHITPGGVIPGYGGWFFSSLAHDALIGTSWLDLQHLKNMNQLWSVLFPDYTDLEIWVVPIMEWQESGTQADVKLMYYDGGWQSMTTYRITAYSFSYNYFVFGSWLRSDMTNPNEWKFQVKRGTGTLRKKDARCIVILKPTY